MTEVASRRITEDDRSTIVQLLTNAFATDPLLRWVYAQDERYLEHFEGFIYAYGGDPFRNGWGLTYEDQADGAVLWQLVDRMDDGKTLERFLMKTVTDSRRTDVVRVFKELGSLHPREPHCFFTFLGRNPLSARSPSALVRSLCEYCDKNHIQIYGDATSRARALYYMQFNAKVKASVQRGTSPRYYGLIRLPQPALLHPERIQP